MYLGESTLGTIILSLPVVVAVIFDILIIGDTTVKLVVTENDKASVDTPVVPAALDNDNVGVNVAI